MYTVPVLSFIREIIYVLYLKAYVCLRFDLFIKIWQLVLYLQHVNISFKNYFVNKNKHDERRITPMGWLSQCLCHCAFYADMCKITTILPTVKQIKFAMVGFILVNSSKMKKWKINFEYQWIPSPILWFGCYLDMFGGRKQKFMTSSLDLADLWGRL